MNIKALEKKAKKDISDEKKRDARCRIYLALSEIDAAKSIVKKLERKYENMLEELADG